MKFSRTLGYIVLTMPSGAGAMRKHTPTRALYTGVKADNYALVSGLSGTANVQAQDRRGRTLLMQALLQNCRPKIIQELISKQVNHDIQDSFGDSALIIAAKKGNLPAVQALLEAGASCDIRNYDNCTACMLAALNGYAPIVAALIDAGAVIDARNDTGETPLMVAASNGHYQIVDILLDEGAQYDLQDNWGHTALMRAVWRGSYKNSNEPCYTNYLQVIERLISAGANLDVQTNQGTTALMDAVSNSNVPIVHKLLDAGAKIDSKNRSNETALILAVGCNQLKLAAALIERGADVTLRTSKGETVLMEGARYASKGLMRVLIGATTDLDARNNKGRTALMRAALAHRYPIASMLIASGAHFNRKLPEYALYAQFKRSVIELLACSKTPFSTGAPKAHEQAKLHTLVMLAQDIPIDLADGQGNTVLHYAVLNNNRVLVALLLYLMNKYGCPDMITYKNRAGQTPVDIAVLKAPQWLLPALLRPCMH